MKKYIKSILCTGIAIMGLAACTDFLETTPSTSVADTGVFKTTQGAQSALYGCYYQLESGWADRAVRTTGATLPIR
jgi:hypothetical protein